MLRYSKLSDSQILARLQDVLEKENVSHTDDGIEAIIFTAQGDMRQVHWSCTRFSVNWSTCQETFGEKDRLFFGRLSTICSQRFKASTT